MEVNINATILKEMRVSRSWTQEQLAEAAGIHPRTLQRVESLGVGSKSTLQALARALEVEVGDKLCLMKIDSTAYVYPAFKVAYADAGP